MMSFLASFHGSSWPSPMTVESNNQLSTRLAIWTHVADGPEQQSQPSISWLARQPHSRLAELQRLLRSH